MTLAEATALVLLYRSCQDPVVRARALRLVPELAEIVDEEPVEWHLVATVDGRVVGRQSVTCTALELNGHMRELGLSFDAEARVLVERDPPRRRYRARD